MEIPLYKQKKGRPVSYDFTPFKKAGEKRIVIHCVPSVQIYNSIKSTFARWRKENGILPGFTFDIHETSIVIWRREKNIP
jgi:hypothetical protein